LECEATAHSARDALARAAKDRAIAAQGDPDADRQEEKERRRTPPPSTTTGAPFITLFWPMKPPPSSICTLRPSACRTSGASSTWRDQILLVIGKYSLENHVLVDLPAPDFPDWTRMDCFVKSWIAGTISSYLAEMVIDRAATARTI